MNVLVTRLSKLRVEYLQVQYFPQTQYLTHEEDLDADTMNVDADADKLEQLELLVEVYQLM